MVFDQTSRCDVDRRHPDKLRQVVFRRRQQMRQPRQLIRHSQLQQVYLNVVPAGQARRRAIQIPLAAYLGLAAKLTYMKTQLSPQCHATSYFIDEQLI